MRSFLRIVTVVAVVLSLSQVAAAADPSPSVLRVDEVQSYGFVLPAAHELEVDELLAVKGEGLASALTVAAAGAFGAAISYTADYCWDVYVDDTVEDWFGEADLEGDADNDRSWEWNEFYSSTAKSASAAFIGGLLLP